MKTALAALLYLFPSMGVPEVELHSWDYIGAPTKACTIRYDFEDNDCYLEALSKEPIVPKRKHK